MLVFESLLSALQAVGHQADLAGPDARSAERAWMRPDPGPATLEGTARAGLPRGSRPQVPAGPGHPGGDAAAAVVVIATEGAWILMLGGDLATLTAVACSATANLVVQ